MDWMLPLIGGLGLGSLITTIASHFLSRRSSLEARFYQEKREAYLGLLDALHKAAVSPSDQNSKAFALWQTRVDLFGSTEVARAAQGIVETNDGPKEKRDQFFRALIDEMRRDLRR